MKSQLGRPRGKAHFNELGHSESGTVRPSSSVCRVVCYRTQQQQQRAERDQAMNSADRFARETREPTVERQLPPSSRDARSRDVSRDRTAAARDPSRDRSGRGYPVSSATSSQRDRKAATATTTATPTTQTNMLDNVPYDDDNVALTSNERRPDRLMRSAAGASHHHHHHHRSDLEQTVDYSKQHTHAHAHSPLALSDCSRL